MLPSPGECKLAFVSAQGLLGLSLPVPSQLSPRGHASSRDTPVSIQFPSKGAKLPAYRTSRGWDRGVSLAPVWLLLTCIVVALSMCL